MSANSNVLVEHHIDLGAQVGILRNALFASGGRRPQRLTPPPYSNYRPLFDAKAGQVQITTVG